MVFPFWYNGEVISYKSDDLDYSNLLYEITKKNYGKQIDSDNFEWQIKKGLFNNVIPVKIKVNTDNISVHISYYVSLFESNILLLFGLLFSVFFFISGQPHLISTPIILGVTAWFINTIRIIFYVKEQLKTFSKFDNNISRQYLWGKQQKWINEEHLCPACGEPLNPYSSSCTQCRLNVKNTKNKPINKANLTSEKNINFEYQLKKRNKG